MKTDSYKPYEYLAVELAMKIQELLEPNEDYPPYEYYPEAKQAINKLSNGKQQTETDVAELIAKVMSDSLSFQYESQAFKDVATFLNRRLKYINRYKAT